MAKTEKAKPKKAPKPKFTHKAQSERFVEAARTLGIEEVGHNFDEALKKIIAPQALPAKKRCSDQK